MGTLNSFQVSGSKAVGIVVLGVDFLKGLVAVLIASRLPDASFGTAAVAGVAAVVGHNFPVWLRFHGGRGLATAAGVFSILCFPAVLLWGVAWAATFVPVRNVNVANAAASVVLMLALWVLPDPIVGTFLPSGATLSGFQWFGTALLAVILVRHVEPVRTFINKSGTRKAAV